MMYRPQGDHSQYELFAALTVSFITPQKISLLIIVPASLSGRVLAC